MNLIRITQNKYYEYAQLEQIYPAGTILINDISDLKRIRGKKIKPIAVMEGIGNKKTLKEMIVSFKATDNDYCDNRIGVCRVKPNNSFFLKKVKKMDKDVFFSASYIGKLWDIIMMIKNYQPGMDFENIFVYFNILEQEGIVEFFGVSLSKNIQPLIEGRACQPISISEYLNIRNMRLSRKN